MIRRRFLAAVAMITLVGLASGNVQAAPPLQSTVDICSRTTEVETAILAKVSGATCSTITDTQLAGITHLAVTGNTNLSIDPGDFAGLTGLLDLNISDNAFSTLNEDIFDGLTSLTELDIYNNNLNTLPSDIFHDLTELRVLDIFDNKITTLPQDIFDHNPKLTSIKLYTNQVTTLDADTFDGLTSLTDLQLNSNQLTALDEDIFDRLTSLTDLQLQGNKLTELPPGIFAGLSSLENLNLSDNRIFELPTPLFEPLDARLVTLNMSENFLTELPDDIFVGLTGIDRLNFLCNSLTDFPLDLLTPFAATITYLNIAANNYDTQPNLVDIGNKLTHMPAPEVVAGGAGRNTCTRPLVPEVTVNFGSDTYTLPEDGTGTVTVTLSPDPERKVTVHIITTNQGEAMDADHSGIPSQLDFNFGETSKTFTIAAEPNEINDDGKSILLTFDTDLLATRVNAGEPTTITIEDDDNPYVTVQFTQGAYTVPEGGTQSITVSLDVDPEREVAVPITATDQNNATPDDYSVPDTITFLDGQTSRTFTFMATDDEEDDDDESVLITFGASLPDRMSTGTLSSTTVSITDNDGPRVVVSFGQPSHTVAEGNSITLTVTLDTEPERPVVIPIMATDQNNATSSDYSVPNSVTFAPNQTSQTLHVHSSR